MTPDPTQTAELESVKLALIQHQQAEKQLRYSVNRAKQAGVSWGTLAKVFGVTRQSVWKRFSK